MKYKKGREGEEREEGEREGGGARGREGGAERMQCGRYIFYKGWGLEGGITTGEIWGRFFFGVCVGGGGGGGVKIKKKKKKKKRTKLWGGLGRKT
jgi:hypothetical protein